MSNKRKVDDSLREALKTAGVEGPERLGEPTLPEMAGEFFRSCLRWYGALFLAMVVVFSCLAVWCGVRFLGASNVPEMIRWGVGLLLCWSAVIGAKIWYWMLLERLALTREVKRVEVLAAHLAARLRMQP